MEASGLFKAIKAVNDNRKKRGVRHPFHAILKLVILGYACRLVWIEHIAIYAKNHWEMIKKELGFTRDYAPDATTIRRALKKINRKELEDAFEGWVSEQIKGQTFTASADGKAMCNVAGPSGEPAQLVNIFVQDLKIAIAQIPTEAKKGEPTVLREALKALFDRYPGLKLLTGDAAYAGRDMCQAIVDLGRDYIVQIKGNQPKVKEVLDLHFDEESKERKPDAIKELMQTVRGHWNVENSLHHVKDRSWLEDKICSKETEPELILGVLRNLSLNLIRGFSGKGSRLKSMPKQA